MFKKLFLRIIIFLINNTVISQLIVSILICIHLKKKKSQLKMYSKNGI